MQQLIKPISHYFECHLIIPGASHVTERAILIASLTDGVSELSGICLNHKTKTLIQALQQAGIVIQVDEAAKSCIIAGGNGKLPKKQTTIWCADVKTVAVFMLVATAGTPGVYHLDGNPKLQHQNLQRLIHLLSCQGAQYIPNDATHLPITLTGADSIEGGEVILEHQICTPMTSALLMLAPYARNHFGLTIPDYYHQPLIDLTCAMMAEFSVLVHRIHQGQLLVPVPQHYQSIDYKVEPNFSLSAYFLAAAALTGGKITIANLSPLSKQASSKILSHLKKMGCEIQTSTQGLVLIGPKALSGIEVTLRYFSSTFLILCVLALFATTPSRIHHAHFLKKREKRRMQALKTEFTKLGATVEMGENFLKIIPSKLNQQICLDTHQDPKLGMALSLTGLKLTGIQINQSEYVTDYYADFYQVLNQLGMKEKTVA